MPTYGENKKEDSQINLYPYWEVFNKTDTKDSLWINQDAFPEIDFDLSKNYIKKINNVTKQLSLIHLKLLIQIT